MTATLHDFPATDPHCDPDGAAGPEPSFDTDLAFDSLAVRAGQHRTPEGEHNDPIFTTSSFVFANAAQAAARFGEAEHGNVYARFTNPTVRAFEQRLAALEGAKHCVGTASGMAAITALALATLKAGDHVIAGSSLFGTTIGLFRNLLPRFGIETTFVAADDLDGWRDAVRDNTAMLFVESPTNPLGEVADIRALAALAKPRNIPLVVDNCFCTPALSRPLSLGADVVIHSATKYLDGQGRCIGGAVVMDDDDLQERVFGMLRTTGPSMSPFNAWVFLKGLETLSIRMRAIGDSAIQLAVWLRNQPGVARVHYNGLPEHPYHELAKSQASGFGGIVAFEVEGGREAAWRVIDATKMLSITANLGDAKTTITHPATTTHGRLSDDQRAAAGITEGLLRVAVGLEDIGDIQRDLARGLHG